MPGSSCASGMILASAARFTGVLFSTTKLTVALARARPFSVASASVAVGGGSLIWKLGIGSGSLGRELVGHPGRAFAGDEAVDEFDLIAGCGRHGYADMERLRTPRSISRILFEIEAAHARRRCENLEDRF